MSSIPFPDFPLDVDVDGPDRLQASTPLAAPSMLHHAASSPSLQNAATPAESVALSIHYQSSDFSELDVDGIDGDDSYFNTIFATTGGNAPSFLDGGVSIAAEDTFGSLATGAHTYATPQPVFGETALFPLSPDKTPALGTVTSPSFTTASIAAARNFIAHDSAPIAGFDGLVSPQQLTKFPPANVSPPNLQAFVVSDLPTQLTPDTPGSRSPEAANTIDRHSLSTEDTSIQAPSMSHAGTNPQVTVSLWGKDDGNDATASAHADSRTAALESASNAADDGFTVASSPPITGRRSRQGIDPLGRPSTELPTSINEDAAAREIKAQNTAVSNWIASTEKQTLNPPENETETRSGPEASDDTVFEGVSDREVGLGNETENVEKSGRTYLKKEPTGPFNATDYEIMLQSTAVWNDRPSVLPISDGPDRHLPQTSQAAIEYFERMLHDNASIVSRAATWGTRRRSLPSVADISEVTSGNLLKKLSIAGRDTRRPSFLDGLRTLVRKPSTSQQQLKRARGASDDDDDAASYFGEGATRGVYETDNDRRDSTKSTGTLGLPRTQSWGKNKQPMPSINTALISMGSNMASIGATHARSGSVSRSHAGSISISPPLVSPRSPLLKVGSAIGLRPRSRSEVRGSTESDHPNLVRMLKKSGGPPVASLATQNATPSFPGSTLFPNPVVAPSGPAPIARVPTPIQIPATQVAVRDPDGGEEDDDDEEGPDADDTDIKPQAGDSPDDLIDKISPDLNGFRDLVIKLNPMLAEKNTFLVDRIAHQQIFRYKGLLNARVKHLSAVKSGTCASGSLCIAQGGAATVLDSRGGRRGRDPLSAASRDGDEMDDLTSPLDGTINSDSFPKHIPMPPTTALPAEFECQLCFQTRTPMKPSDWTKHVHEDVQPFTCTWERCRDPKMFKRKADWVRHENEGHRRLEWWTCDVDECRHTCYRRDNFLQHLVREHKFPEPQYKTKAAIKRAGTVDETWRRVERCHGDSAGPSQDEPCRFCGKAFPTWKKLTVHVAKHLEQISLPILRLVERKDVDADTIISPVQDPPPRTFAAFSSPTDIRQPGGLLGGSGSSGLAPATMSSAPGLDSRLLHQPPHLDQPVAGYAATGMHDSSGFMYPSVPQVVYQQQQYYEQPQYGGLSSHMHSLDAAALEVSSGYGAGPAFTGHHLPVTSGSFLAASTTQYMPDTSGISASAYQSLSGADAIGLQATSMDSSGPLAFDTRIDASASGSAGDQYTPQGSISPYQHSPHHPQGQFFP